MYQNLFTLQARSTRLSETFEVETQKITTFFMQYLFSASCCLCGLKIDLEIEENYKKINLRPPKKANSSETVSNPDNSEKEIK